MHLFTSDETVVAFGCSAMHYFCPFYFLLDVYKRQRHIWGASV